MVDLPCFIHLDSPHLHWEQESVRLRFHYQPFVHLVSNQFFEPGTFLLILVQHQESCTCAHHCYNNNDTLHTESEAVSVHSWHRVAALEMSL